MAYVPDMAGEPVSNVYEECLFRVRVTFGSSVVASYKAKDVTFARNSAGNYTVTLPKTYREITEFSAGIQDASGAVLFGVITSETVATDGKIVVEIRTEAGTATDPADGDKLFLSIGVSSSVSNDRYSVTV